MGARVVCGPSHLFSMVLRKKAGCAADPPEAGSAGLALALETGPRSLHLYAVSLCRFGRGSLSCPPIFLHFRKEHLVPQEDLGSMDYSLYIDAVG